MKRLVMMIGPPAAGKSTYAAGLGINNILNTDSIRQEIYGNADRQGGKEWDIFFERLEALLESGEDIVIDNTNLKKRGKILTAARSKEYDVEYKVMTTPLWLALERNLNRERVVPESVILNMYRQFNDIFHLFYIEPDKVEFIGVDYEQ